MYDSPCMTWTVYWTLILHRLPTLILPALFTDYPECLPPAPIQSLSSDSDSALPTLCLKLVIELCLSDLHTLLIKLHMDPNAPDSALHIQSTASHTIRQYILCAIQNHLYGMLVLYYNVYIFHIHKQPIILYVLCQQPWSILFFIEINND